MNMKIRFFATMVVAIVFIACISSCAKDDEYLGNGNDIFAMEKAGEGDDAIVLGEKMNDPYNMAFMSEAFQQLKAEGTELPFDVLEPTGLYVRVLAGSTAELDLLEADTNMTWFDYPLDYEIAKTGTYYHDPTLPDSATWKYGVIPVGYSLPSSLQHELLYNVFIPDDHPEYKEYEEAFDRLEEISESLCGYEEEDDEKEISTKASKWNPSATIKVWDDTVGYIPLRGAKVTVRRLTKYRTGITNANGYYSFNTKYRKKVNYSIIWERGYWDIRYGWAQAYYNGPEQKSAWDLKISKGGKSIMYATIHRAAWNAYYGYFGELQRPYLITGKMKIRYIHDSGGSVGLHCSFWNVFGAIADIRVWGFHDGELRPTDKIYGTVIHELAHQSHQRYMTTIQFWQVSSFIKESWSRCVQCILTSHHYQNDLGYDNYWHERHVQNWSPQVHGVKAYQYTPLFIDMIDDYNQNAFDPSLCKDNVSGYTLKEIQNRILGTSYGMHSLRQTLKANLLHGTTEAQIDELVDNYEGFGF